MLKCTGFFSLGAGGWSETWYQPGSATPPGMVALKTLMSYRLPFLVPQATLIGLRVSIVENPAAVQTESRSDLGTCADGRDVKNVALFLPLGAANNVRRIVILKGVPDTAFVGGLYIAPLSFDPALLRWINQLIQQQWCILAQDKVNFPLRNVQAVSSTGIVTMFTDPVWSIPAIPPLKIKFFRTHDTLGSPVKGQYDVANIIDATHYQLADWPAGRLVVGGKARKYVLIAAPVTQNLLRAFGGSRKTGRPFGSSVGRRKAGK